MVIHKDDRFATDTWREIRKWTNHLDAQWKFGRARFTEVVRAAGLAPLLLLEGSNSVLFADSPMRGGGGGGGGSGRGV